jgi:hypothetical protein
VIDPSSTHLPEPAVAIAHAADFYRRYPGEIVTLFTRVEAHRALPGFTLRIAVPEGLIPGDSARGPAMMVCRTWCLWKVSAILSGRSGEKCSAASVSSINWKHYRADPARPGNQQPRRSVGDHPIGWR